MSRAAISVLVFGLYMIAQGAVLMAAPDFLLELFGLAPSADVWPRVVGWALVALGFYYVQSARNNLRSFFGWTVPVRIGQFVAFVSFVALGLVQPVILLISGVELAAGVWTWLELRRA